MSRRGFSLVEMLVAIMTIPLVMWVVTQMVRTLLDDMPRDRRVINEQFRIDQILQQLQMDFDQTYALPDQWQGHTQDANTLLLAQTQALVYYRHEGNTVSRFVGSDVTPQRQWTLKYARLHWQSPPLLNGVEGIEVECYVPHKRGKRTRHRFERTYLFIPGEQS